MSIIIPANSASAAGGFQVDNSVRFNGGSDDHLKRTLGTATNVKKFTMSWWFKGTGIATGSMFEAASGNVQNGAFVYLKTDDILIDSIVGNSETMKLVPTAHYQDYSAWYHFCLAVDVTLGTAADRNKLYINGERVTDFVTQTNAGQNATRMFNTAVEHLIGVDVYNTGGSIGSEFNGYISEFVFIDGSQEEVTAFGEFEEDSGIWRPIDPSALTFGNNGFYLDFQDSSALGNDVSGNNNDFTVVNLTANSQSTDTCTNNFATMNILDNYFASSVFSNGNLTVVTNSSARTWNNSTIGLTSGKYYCEMKSVGVGAGALIGIIATSPNSTTNRADDNAYAWVYLNGGSMKNDGTSQSGTWASWAASDIIGMALDLDNNKIYFSKNGTWQNTGTANPSTGTDGFAITAVSSLPASQAGNYFIMCQDDSTSNNATFDWNFGSPSYAISSGNADGNGYGNFEYAVPTGFLSLCTANLSRILS